MPCSYHEQLAPVPAGGRQEQEKELNTRRPGSGLKAFWIIWVDLKVLETLNAYKDKLGLPRAVPQSVLPII